MYLCSLLVAISAIEQWFCHIAMPVSSISAVFRRRLSQLREFPPHPNLRLGSASEAPPTSEAKGSYKMAAGAANQNSSFYCKIV